jgi:hypothetical protein
LLAEALQKLAEIRVTELEMADAGVWGALPQADRDQKLSVLDTNEKTAKNSLMLANQTVAMMAYLTTRIKSEFLCPELVDRLVAMLLTVMTKLGGRSGVELKV